MNAAAAAEASSLSSNGTCFYCDRDAISTCKDCHLVAFCSKKEHKAIHKPKNAKRCRPFKVVIDPVKGQCLVAVRQIRPLEVILSDFPAVCGPYAWPPNPQCLNCLKIISCDKKCSACDYPVCSPDCQNGDWHSIECRVFQSVNHRYTKSHELSPYAPINTIRFLAIREKNPSLWESLLTLRDHNAERQEFDPDLWRKHEEKVADFVVNSCKMPNTDRQLVFRLMGILSTNSANLDVDEGYGKGSCLYPSYAKVNHSCFCKTKTLNNLPNKELQMRASTVIQPGEEIHSQYLKPVSNTMTRRHHLRSKWHFECTCTRCSDAYELGSHLSSLKCPQIKCSGALISSNPIHTFATWQCDLCLAKMPFSYVIERTKNAQRDLKDVNEKDDIITHYERFLYEQEKFFHPNHQVLIEIKMHLAVLYGNLKSYGLGQQLSNPQIERKLQCIRDVLETLSKVETGYSTWRGKMLSELVKTNVFLAQRRFMKGQITKAQLDKVFFEEKTNQAYIAFNHCVYFEQPKNGKK